jgi:hypothetical protein
MRRCRLQKEALTGAVSQVSPCEETTALRLEKPYSSSCSMAYRVAAALEVTPNLL